MNNIMKMNILLKIDIDMIGYPIMLKELHIKIRSSSNIGMNILGCNIMYIKYIILTISDVS